MRLLFPFLMIVWLLPAACEQPGRGGALTDIPYTPQPYDLSLPDHFGPMPVPADNPLTVAGVELGRQLFYDPVLSLDSTLSCAGCHLPGLAFTDGLPVSRGVNGRTGKRSAPSLLNVGYVTTGLFWDGRAETLEAQAVHPVEDSLEMAGTWELVTHRLQLHPRYPALFRRAFGIEEPEEIDQKLVTKALAQFERSLLSFNARFDQVQRGEVAFTASEKRGWTIFFDASPEVPAAECNHCHVDPLFTTQEYFNNGLDSVSDLLALPDRGLGAVTGRYFDNGKFRAPTLRNIELTAPYMHDGRFATLEEVIDHYNRGGHFAPNLSPNVRPLGLKEQDKKDLIAFLRTLTDTTVAHDPAYQPPGP